MKTFEVPVQLKPEAKKITKHLFFELEKTNQGDAFLRQLRIEFVKSDYYPVTYRQVLQVAQSFI